MLLKILISILIPLHLQRIGSKRAPKINVFLMRRFGIMLWTA